MILTPLTNRWNLFVLRFKPLTLASKLFLPTAYFRLFSKFKVAYKLFVTRLTMLNHLFVVAEKTTKIESRIFLRPSFLNFEFDLSVCM